MNTFVNLIPSKNFTYLLLSIFFSMSINAQNTGAIDSLTSGEYDYYPYDYTYDSSNNSGVKDFFGLAGGAVIGRKWVNQKKYTFEIHAGVGRYFAFEKTNNAYREGTAYPRINFAIGKRF